MENTHEVIHEVLDLIVEVLKKVDEVDEQTFAFASELLLEIRYNRKTSSDYICKALLTKISCYENLKQQLSNKAFDFIQAFDFIMSIKKIILRGLEHDDANDYETYDSILKRYTDETGEVVYFSESNDKFIKWILRNIKNHVKEESEHEN